MIAGLTGVVLAGGRSSRFGSDKALADWQGAPLVQSVARAMRRVLPEVLVVTRDPGALAFLQGDGVRVLTDLYPEGHPLGGLYTGLQALNTGHAFVRACDMPFLSPGLIETLWEARADYQAVIPVWQDRRQPLSGIYSKTCAGVLRCSIENGDLAITPILDSIPTRFCLESELAAVDPEGLSFMDIDTQGDYQRARRRLPC